MAFPVSDMSGPYWVRGQIKTGRVAPAEMTQGRVYLETGRVDSLAFKVLLCLDGPTGNQLEFCGKFDFRVVVHEVKFVDLLE